MSDARDPNAATPPASAPSVFLSYSSEDRAAARRLRDALAATGLDVWYDENELGGGDAWDQKIRRQIRECAYFMPLISASTERRKEGYFRREWRLAVDRTLDMADDVMFILPIVLDGTSETAARVPERFLSVQWIRAPDGVLPPSFDALARRLLAGDHAAPPPVVTPRPGTARPAAPRVTPGFGAPSAPTSAASVPPSVPSANPAAGAAPAAPPPLAAPATAESAGPAAEHLPPKMPAFPQPPENGRFGHQLKFIAEVLWWVVVAAWSLIRRLPKWARILVYLWLILLAINRCERTAEAPPRPAATSAERERKKAARAVEEEQGARTAREIGDKLTAIANSPGSAPDKIARIGAEIARAVAGDTAGPTVLLVPFAGPEAENPAVEAAGAVFLATFTRVTQARPGLASLHTARGPAAAPFVLAGEIVKNADVAELRVRLERASQSTPVWSETFPLAAGTADAHAAKIAAAILAAVPAPR
jgi:hypothetical protein